MAGCPGQDDPPHDGGTAHDGTAGGTTACVPGDCQNKPVPAIGCATGPEPTFLCTRGTDGSCAWGPPICGPAPDAGSGTTDAGGAACKVDADCRLVDDYCTGCDCRALSKTDPDPVCAGPGVRCLAQPCMGKTAQCQAGKCAVRDKPAAGQTWYATCGDPVCGAWRPKDGVPLCTTQKAGDACANAGERCDPKGDCNALLVCATADPTKSPGGCPISRRDTKRDIRYLGPDDLRRYHDELLTLRLATWRYKHDPARERLGFIIDDHEQSVAVDAPQSIVDLYGYTSLAVATVQLQARELADVQRELAAMRRKLAALEGRRRAR